MQILLINSLIKETENMKSNRVLALIIIGLEIIIVALLAILVFGKIGKSDSERESRKKTEKDIEKDNDADIAKTKTKDENSDDQQNELPEESSSTRILYSESYYLDNVLGILSAISECETDTEMMELLTKYCINERTKLINSTDSLFFKTGNNECARCSIQYGARADYIYDEEGNHIKTHRYYKDGFLITESNDMPLGLNYRPSYDFIEEENDKVYIRLKGSETESIVRLGEEAPNHLAEFGDNYADFDNCRSTLEYEGYSINDVETIYEDCSITTYNDPDDFAEGKIKWTYSDMEADIIKLKDGTWLLGCYKGGGDSFDIYCDERLVATISSSSMDEGGGVTFYYYEQNNDETSYDINPLYYEFLDGKIPAESKYNGSYYISENEFTTIYEDEYYSSVHFIDLDNDSELELYISDYYHYTSGTVFNIENGELIEWMVGGLLTNAPLGCDMEWAKYDDSVWFYSTIERSAWGILMEKYEGTKLVDSFELKDKLLEDGQTHEYSYRGQIISEEEFRRIHKDIFNYDYWR